MAVVVDIAPKRTLADLDEALRALITRELERVGIGTVAVTFEAPARDQTATWPSPALNLFLYDVREAGAGRDRTWRRGAVDGPPVMVPGALRLDCSYAVTAWTRSPLDEHRLLSQVLSILLAYPVLTADLLVGDLVVGEPPVPLPTRVAHGKEEGRADFWTAIGSPYKVSLEYVVTTFVEPGVRRARGAPVQVAEVDAGRGDVGHAQGGTVVRADGSPAAGAVVVAAGVAVVAGADGRFVLSGLAAGDWEVQVRDADGTVMRASVTVPGPAVALRLP
jgi:hypothetical protein